MKNTIIKVPVDACTGCGACYNKCPVNAIEMRLDKEGFLVPVVDNERCIECENCVLCCPIVKPLDKKKTVVRYGIPKGKYVSESEICTSIVSNAYKLGIQVCGSKYEDDFKNVKQAWLEKESESALISEKKPVLGNPMDTYKKTEEYLKQGTPVLYVARACQLDGLYKYLESDENKLYTMEFVCNSQSSAEALRTFVEEYSSGKKIKALYFHKNNKATDMQFEDGTSRSSNYGESRWAEGENGIINRECCFDCQYAKKERVADITIMSVNNQSYSYVVLVNSKKGAALLKEIGSEICNCPKISEEELANCETNLLRKISPAPSRRFFFTHTYKGYENALWYGKGMRYDVGIIGWWFASNYGSSLTYYALAKILQKTGRELIFVHVPKVDNTPWDKDAQQTIDFIGKRFKITKYRDMMHIHEVNMFCDSFMLGSDQMWTPLATQLVGYTFFLDFVDLNKKKIAFSTSFGQDKFIADEATCQIIGDYLKRFDAISVREYTGVDICRDTFGVDAEQVIDPVFLCSTEEYDKMFEGISIDLPKKYLLTYILDPTPEKEAAAKEIARHKNLEIISIMSMKEYERNASQWHVGKIVPKPSTEEFLYYLKNCDYLLTDSHHGACMGIIYERPYVAITNASRGVTRFETVARAFGLENRVVYDPMHVVNNKEIYKPIDYEKVKTKIENEKTKALAWLESAFAKETKEAQETVNTKLARLDITNKFLSNTVKAYEARLKQTASNASKTVSNFEDNFDFVKIRLLASLLRDYGIKHIVLSPGGRDVPIIRMFENNEKDFILHRVTDERSAAYYGLGLASQLGKPVACICTSGTAASNYLPAVTEAYFTGIPLVMITADRISVYHGQGEDQTIPQNKIYNDVVKMEISLPDNGGGAIEHQMRRDISACILESTHNGNGPVHINIPIQDIGIGATLPKEKWALLPSASTNILRASFINGDEEMHKWAKSLEKSPRVLVVYGQNKPLSKEEKMDLERFASKYNCAIVTDSISNYESQYTVNPFNMLTQISQADFDKYLKPDILITVGGKRLMNDPLTFKIRASNGVRHWSVVPDGSIKDFYFKITSVIESTQKQFFRWFADNAGKSKNDQKYLSAWKDLVAKYSPTPATGFNSFYIQEAFFPQIPKNSFLHLGVGQSFFFVRRHNIDPSVEVYCNMGTNGIDGCVSTFMGQSALIKDKLSFLIVGDLAFFYDMNSIWNKSLNKNMRILLVNNNGSGLLRNHGLKAVTSVHNTSAEGWVKSTGFEYMSASSKEEFNEKLKYFMSKESDKALFFEVFCD